MRLTAPFFTALVLTACGDDSTTHSSAGGAGGGGDQATSSTSTVTTAQGGDASSGSTSGGGLAEGGASSSSGGGGDQGGAGGSGGSGGSGGALPEAEDFGSGTRLRARYLDLGPGARIFESFIDTALDDVECSPNYATDGALRCIPDVSQGGSYYTDATCSSTVIRFDEGCPPPRPYFGEALGEPVECARSDDNGAAGTRAFEVRRIGDPVVPDAFYRLDGANCIPDDLPQAFLDASTFYAVGGVVEPDELAAFEETIEPRDGGLAVAVVRSEDGAHVLGSAHNADTGELCARRDQTCFPPHVAADTTGSFHEDAECADSALVAQSTYGCSETPPPTIALVSTPDGMVPHELGEPVEPDVLYRSSSDTCSLLSPIERDRLRVFEIGAPIEGGFPTLAWVEIGSGRIRTAAIQSTAGTLMGLTTSLLDSEIDQGCQLARDPFGALRCVARVRSSPSDHFTDAACTIPFFFNYELEGQDYFAETGFVCGDVFTIGESVYDFVPYDGPVYYLSNDVCTYLINTPGTTLGDDLGLDVFAEVPEIVE